MNWLLGKLPWVSIGLAVALLAAIGFGKYEASRAGELEIERNDARNQVQVLASTNAGNQTAIAALQGAVEKWQKLAQPSVDMMAAAERAAAAAKDLEARSRALATREKADHAKPDCAALLALDIGGACPAIADGVRSRATSGGVQGQGGGGAGAGRPAPTGPPD